MACWLLDDVDCGLFVADWKSSVRPFLAAHVPDHDSPFSTPDDKQQLTIYKPQLTLYSHQIIFPIRPCVR